MTPTREIYWNVVGGGWIYGLLVVALGALVVGLRRRVRLWRLGRPGTRVDRLPERLGGVVREVFGHARLLRVPVPGVAHALLFYGFLVLFGASLLIALQEWSGVRLLQGELYLWYSLVSDGFGILGLAGLSLLLWRRAVQRPPELPSRAGDWFALALLLLLFLQGFLIEGARIAVTELRQQPELARWSPGGLAVARLLSGADAESLRALHRAGWWLHAVTALGFVGWLGFGKLDHVFYGPASVFLRSLGPSGKLSHPDVEAMLETDPEALAAPGVGRIEELERRQLLALDACTQCGRCEAVCPAHLAGTPLSPRRLVADLRAHLHEVGPTLLAGGPADDRPALVGPAAEGAAVSDEALWACRTCGACQHACPVRVEHVPAIVDLRRRLVMGESRLPDSLRASLRSLEDRMHPWAGLSRDREAWMEGLDVRVLAPGEPAEWLLWVGCAGAMVDRNVRVTRALARVLAAAGVDFAVLGTRECCTGDPARRAGDELTFQTCAKQNIETLTELGVRKIVTACPHCLNALRCEYPDFGGRFEVVHHSELLAELQREGRLPPLRRSTERLTYHDPCYLGRHNGVYDAPRRVLGALASAGGLVELPRRREASLCCGAGGGHAFMDEDAPRRPSELRADEVRASGARTAAVACPFCLQMLEDALGAQGPEGRVRAADLAELVAEALEGDAHGRA